MILFDTSIIVACCLGDHPSHDKASSILQDHSNGIISSHSLVELYSVLTRAPFTPKITPDVALRMIRKNAIDRLNIKGLSNAGYLNVLKTVSDSKLKGGIIYDAIILAVAIENKVKTLATLNQKDFRLLSKVFDTKFEIIP